MGHLDADSLVMTSANMWLSLFMPTVVISKENCQRKAMKKQENKKTAYCTNNLTLGSWKKSGVSL